MAIEDHVSVEFKKDELIEIPDGAVFLTRKTGRRKPPFYDVRSFKVNFFGSDGFSVTHPIDIPRGARYLNFPHLVESVNTVEYGAPVFYDSGKNVLNP